jgi:molybdopterin converting factor small subunit
VVPALPPVTVLLFATAREAAGRGTLRRPIPREGLALDAFLAELTETYPRLGPVLPSCRFGRNGRYLRSRSARLRPGDELAIHPPYSGG